jgi:hypothetical protein
MVLKTELLPLVIDPEEEEPVPPAPTVTVYEVPTFNVCEVNSR